MSIDSTDQDLLARVRSGDTAAFGDLYAHHSAAAHRAARRIARDQTTAEDIVSESFARVFSALQSGKGPEGDLFPYLLVTMRNVAATWGRDTNRWTPVGDDLAFQPRDARDLVEGADSAPVDELAVSLTSSAFATLPRRWRTVLWYLEVEGESATQVGQRLGLTDVAVRQLARRAREGLREAYLGAYLGGGPVVGGHVPTSDLVQMARGKINLRRRAVVEQHLDSCPDCTRMLFEATEENSTLRALAIPFWVAAGLAIAKTGAAIWGTVVGSFHFAGKSGKELAASVAGAATAVVGAAAVMVLIIGVATGQFGGAGGRSSAGGLGSGGGSRGGASGSGSGGSGTGTGGAGASGSGSAGPTSGASGSNSSSPGAGGIPTGGATDSTNPGGNAGTGGNGNATGGNGTGGNGTGGNGTGPTAPTVPTTPAGPTTPSVPTTPTVPTSPTPIPAASGDLTWKWQAAASLTTSTLKITNNTSTSWGIDATIVLNGAVFTPLPYCGAVVNDTVVCHLNQNKGDNLGPLAPGNTSFHVLPVTTATSGDVTVSYMLVPVA